jgi:hypothetical protein
MRAISQLHEAILEGSGQIHDVAALGDRRSVLCRLRIRVARRRRLLGACRRGNQGHDDERYCG